MRRVDGWENGVPYANEGPPAEHPDASDGLPREPDGLSSSSRRVMGPAEILERADLNAANTATAIAERARLAT